MTADRDAIRGRLAALEEGLATAEAYMAAERELWRHAPTDLAALLDEVERLRAEVAAEREAVVEWLRGPFGRSCCWTGCPRARCGGTVADLARALVAAPWWEWREGMAYHENATPGMGLCRGGRGRVWADGEAVLRAATPDLHDAATAGILLDMLVESTPLQAVGYSERDGMWWVGAHVAPVLGEAAARALLEVRGGG